MRKKINHDSCGISADTLFHFTGTAENLISILTNEFEPRFCLENINASGTIVDDENSAHAIPMVCFCDIPLSHIKEHLQFYGSYGIGFSKAWGKSKGISPVLYTYPESHTAKYLTAISSHLDNHVPKLPEDENVQKTYVDFFELISFIKPYEGKILRDGKYSHKRFYDEREWRFVPYLYAHKEAVDYRLSRKEFMNPIKKAQANSLVASVSRLSFGPSDIKYIFVKEENEILDMISAIRQIKGKYDHKIVDLLSSRIISSQQVISDF